MMGQMSCRDVEHFLLEYLEGRLGWKRRLLFRMHLMMCTECVAYIRAYESTVALGKAVFEDPDTDASDVVPPDLIDAILAARGQ